MNPKIFHDTWNAPFDDSQFLGAHMFSQVKDVVTVLRPHKHTGGHVRSYPEGHQVLSPLSGLLSKWSVQNGMIRNATQRLTHSVRVESVAAIFRRTHRLRAASKKMLCDSMREVQQSGHGRKKPRFNPKTPSPSVGCQIATKCSHDADVPGQLAPLL